ncbi:sodium/glucose cotransporter 4 [Lingula anatina]|uniref:Sodium/glucose cotransporter 4 n=1 Tax=Lingula anatina TaxID=7574 RepID=A0A2R2MRT5_LINAN|nr:sodium/glucose cotransporter 4 [Lingula anatina]|eukprot:XP_023932969.1 sodium/glucose cotransporter 4 [Lingula anatina]
MAAATGGLQHWGDYLAITLYFVVVLSVGIWSICRARRSSVKDYFLAGRSVTWWPIGLSLFASNIGSEHFVGLAGTGSASGFAVIAFEWNAIILLLMLAWIFLPMYFASGIYTMPEYLSRRYGGQRLRIYLSVLALATYIFNNISTLLAYVERPNSVGTLADCTFIRVGGWEALYTKYMAAVPSSVLNQTFNITARCGFPREDAFHIFRDPAGMDYPWIGLMLRTSLVGMWYWCANQVIVQRSLAAKSITHAKGASILAGYLKIIPLFIMVMPGMIARVLFPDEVGCATPEACEAVCGNTAGCSNIAYPLLVLEVLPLGLRGLLLAVMMSAVVSTLTSTFNSASTVFTLDLWRRFRKRASDVETLIVSRIFVVILCVLGVLWMPIMQNAQGGQLFQYATAITGYLQAPTCAVFIMSAFWTRATEPGAFYGMLGGQLVGIVRFVLDFAYDEPSCGEPDTRPPIVSQIHYLYFAEIQIAVALCIAIPISYMTKPLPKERLAGLTFWTVKDKLQEHIARANVTSTNLEYIGSEANVKDVSEDKVTFEVENSGSDEQENGLDLDIKKREEAPEPSWRLWLRSLCGLPPKGSAQAHHHSLKLVPMSLDETPFWRRITNMNAVVILVVLGFLYGFFA